MTRPTDDELEAMAARLEYYAMDQLPLDAVAMLRACKGRVRVDNAVAALSAIPVREERLGGQTFKYIKLSEAVEALSTLEPAPDQGEWQPIETCPASHVLFYGNTRHDARIAFTGWKGMNGRTYADSGDSVKPTHWMPLPAPDQKEPDILDSTSARAVVSEIGNQIHNIGCEYQENEGLSERIGDLASQCWAVARQLSAEPDPDHSEWNAALEAAANEIDCCCDGLCLFPPACPKDDVKSIRALKKGIGHE